MKVFHSTGKKRIDLILEGLVGILERSCPGRIAAYYLTGSFAEGRETRGSDLDLCLVFSDDAGDCEKKLVQDLVSECNRVCDVELDVEVTDEFRLSRLGSVELKFASRLLYGRDIRESVPLPQKKFYSRMSCFRVLSHMCRIRRSEMISCPAAYPNPTDRFYGYTTELVKKPDGTRTSGLTGLVGCVARPAAALLIFDRKIYIRSLQEFIDQYRSSGDREWSAYIEELITDCRENWGYRVPEARKEQEKLAALSEKALLFENMFLERFRSILQEDLEADPEGDVWMTEAEIRALFGKSSLDRFALAGMENRRAGEVNVFHITGFSHVLALAGAARVVYLDSALVDLLPDVVDRADSNSLSLVKILSDHVVQSYVKVNRP